MITSVTFQNTRFQIDEMGGAVSFHGGCHYYKKLGCFAHLCLKKFYNFWPQNSVIIVPSFATMIDTQTSS